MSVRNQYANNHYKIAPLPLSSNHITNARNAARQRNLYRPPDDERASATENAAVASGVEKISNFSNIKFEKDTDNLFAAKKNDKMKRKNEFTMYGKRELNKFVTNGSRNRGKDSYFAEGKQSNMKNKFAQGNVPLQKTQKSRNTPTPSRPMSARPDSRWERRVRDESESFTDEESDDTSAIVKTVSDKQKLKIQRSDSDSMPELQARPKTGHGRHKSIDSNPELERKVEHRKEELGRPKSRIGKVREFRRSSNESVDSLTALNKDSRSGQSSAKSAENDSVFREVDYNIGINTFYPDLADKIDGIDDINLHIEDIDRDVDPVLFFMQDVNTSPVTSAKTRSSLSKDAINIITNEKNSRQMIKPSIGFQGNNQNKRHSVPETIDRCHGNRVLSLQNSIAEGNQRYFNNGRQDRIKSDSGENVYKSWTNTVHIDKAQSTNGAMKRDSEVGKHTGNYDAGVTHSYSLANRKPRKLKPITPSNVEE
ncbi:uncharacterized protein LOC132746826 [Ruditapes philippinarum]|uniref:uncharacterized protein LOC132746826 n=1 Tax=Ruditapes philippinarum TaxID=129788 RepID=UPI00295BECCF|nr:uncharacterized protein LOC132746826 [Ruditapes philippinarum]